MFRWLLDVDARSASWLGAAIVIVIGVPLAAVLNIWIDEAFTLHTTGAGPLYAWNQAIVFEAQPPLYFVVESLWRRFDESSVVLARFPSTIFAALAVAVIVRAAHRIAPRLPPLGVAVVTAFNPIVIWAAVEMRVYPLVLLIGAILVWTFVEGFLVPAPSRAAQACYAVCAIVGLYTQYYVGFLLAAQAISVLAVRRESFRPFAFATAAITAGFLPLAQIALTHVRSSSQFVLPTSFAQAVHEVLDAAFVAMLPHELTWSGTWKTAGFVFAGLLVIVLGAIGRPTFPRGAAIGVVVQFLLSLGIFTVLFSLEGVPLVSIKYLTVMAPLSLLTAFLFLSQARRKRALTFAIAFMAYALFTASDLFSQYAPPLVKPGDWQRVAETISADDASTPVSVFPSELEVPLSWYLPGPILPIPGPMPFLLNYVRLTTLGSEADVSRVLDPVHDRSERLWLVTEGACEDSQQNYYNYHCRFMEGYLQRHYRVLRSISFRGALARLYERIPNRESKHDGSGNLN